jgi:hypothetical protein
MADTRNIHQRINAALIEMGDLSPDKKHPSYGFEYVSVQKLLAAWRKASIPLGIRTTMGIHDGELTLSFVNTDAPDDVSATVWPVYPEDKGWSYTVKYALMKSLLVADDEPDEGPVVAQSTPPELIQKWAQPSELQANDTASVSCPTDGCLGHLVQRATKTGKSPGSPYLVCSLGKNGCGLSPIWDTTLEAYIEGKEDFANVTTTFVDTPAAPEDVPPPLMDEIFPSSVLGASSWAKQAQKGTPK